MRHSNKIWALVVGMAVLPSTSARAAPLDFDCDVPANHYSSLKMDIGGATEISGTITAVELRSGKNLPVAGARIIDADEKNAAGFQLVAPTSRAEHFDLVINANKNGTLKRYSAGRVDRDTAVAFRLVLSADGSARLEIGGSSIDIPADPIHSGNAMIFCSTGQFKFAGLRFTDPQPAADSPSDQNSRVSE